MEKALVISTSEKAVSTISPIITQLGCNQLLTASTYFEAKKLAKTYNFDLFVILNQGETELDVALAKELIGGTNQVVFIVKNESYEQVTSILEEFGIITISQPISKSALLAALKMAKATYFRLKNFEKINTKLTQKIEDIKIIDRAKLLLISYLKMSELEAHKYIEKKAMDSRISRREIAENLVKMYQS